MANKDNQICLEMKDRLSEKLKLSPVFTNLANAATKYVDVNDGKETRHCFLWDDVPCEMQEILYNLLYKYGSSSEYSMLSIQGENIIRYGYLAHTKMRMTLSIVEAHG